ncbi:leishmanolysin family protein (macronuclear) [Tetrahymena thermophila SB210]|uniref:Leishmanolysin family protein n=1 Tax=Tetrahymena thermophila (strain SB210) TaxID=312017 RepID=I7M8L8_TETTS|nr:leishmanolysin family protein [Tetrahymena thermophila SB210]EAR98422.1 leishmanolysin family protein [Tetrahymena thermophila SB210]|eukprot:XP_001018667.1 leishmanolysin family protein [Tetrahymena thermophila SB210]
MNKFIAVLLIACFAFTQVQAHSQGHKCAHEKMNEKLDKEIVDLIIDENERHLQNANPRNFKITYDMAYFDNLPNTPEMQIFRRSCEKAIKIASNFFSNLITIVPKPTGSMKWDLRLNKCGEATIPAADKTTDKDSDLHLYITFTDEPQETYLAYAGWCRFLRIVGPTHGQVNFNLGLLKSYNFANSLQFQDLVGIVIHEMTHVLGFSGSDIANWVDANKKPHVNPTVQQTVRGMKTTFVKTPNVLEFAKKYYGCSTIPGMPLENQGGSGSSGSHWETTIIQDELMNASISPTIPIFTGFTAALLRDTGFYASVNSNMEEKSFYGKDAGCSFIIGSCDDKKREFCTVGSFEQKCDYYYHGVGQCNSSTFLDNDCDTYQTFSNAKCFDDSNNFQNNPTYKSAMGVSLGSNSKCFNSSLINEKYKPIKEQGLCYTYSCTAANQVIVSVGGTQVTCSKNGQQLKVPGYSGLLTCPEKLDEFCAYKKLCPNNCSSNGFCNNGTCICMNGFRGAACDQVA